VRGVFVVIVIASAEDMDTPRSFSSLPRTLSRHRVMPLAAKWSEIQA
jgi:hypothetical protein